MDINATLFGQMITFAIFVWFTMKFVWPPLQKMLKEREAKIAEGLYASERGHKELELSQKQAVKELREARQQATQTVDQAHKQAEFIIEDAKREANEQRENILTLGRAELEQSKRAAEETLRKEVIGLIILTTEKMLKRSLNENEQKALLEMRSLKGFQGEVSGGAPGTPGGAPHGDRAEKGNPHG